jgi:hypothetical protein
MMFPARKTYPAFRAGLLTLLGLAWTSSQALATSSSFSPADEGTKVLFLLLQNLGYQTTRVFDVDELDNSTQAIFLLERPPAYTRQELLRWVWQGHLLILAPPLEDEGVACGDFQLGERVIKRQLSSLRIPNSTLHPDLHLHPSSCLLRLPPAAAALAGKPEAPLAYEQSLGDGGMLVLAHHEVLLNQSLDADDTVVLLRRWLSQNVSSGAKIAFFEDRQSGQLLEMMRRSHLTLFFIHGLLLLLLFYWSIIHRFGDPAPTSAHTRRAFAQHAQALGRLYQHNGSSAHVLKHQYERFLHRLLGASDSTRASTPGRRAGKQDRTMLAAIIATRSGRRSGAVESLLTQVELALSSAESPDGKDLQRHFRLSQSLAALQQGSTAHSAGGKRGRQPFHHGH